MAFRINELGHTITRIPGGFEDLVAYESEDKVNHKSWGRYRVLIFNLSG